MPIDIAFERHTGAQAADASLRKLETELSQFRLPGAMVINGKDPKSTLVTIVALSSPDDTYGLKAVYVPADDKKPDHIAVTARLGDGAPLQAREIIDLLLSDVFDYTRN